MKNLNRWVYAIIGVVIFLLIGMIYAWSVLSTPIAAEFTQWNKSQLSLTFTITMMMFCAGSMIAGFTSKKIKSKYFVWIAAVMLLAGFWLTSEIQSLGMLYFGFGILSGLAGGMAYNTVLSTVSAWFTDKQGMISGILLMGFGISAFIIGKIYTGFTPDYIGGWRISFKVLAILAFVVLLICGIFFKKPDADFVVPAPRSSKKVVREPASDISTGQMLKQKAFWLYFAWAILVSVAGLAMVSQASGIAWQVSPDVNAGTIATIVGLISIFNGIGRVIFGSLFDKFGFRFTMLIDSILFAAATLILIAALISGQFLFISIGFIIGGLAYGGVTPTNSAIINDFFGRTYYAMNLPIINASLMIASFGSTIAGKLYDGSGSYMSTVIMMLGVVIVGFIAFLGIRRPVEK